MSILHSCQHVDVSMKLPDMFVVYMRSCCCSQFECESSELNTHCFCLIQVDAIHRKEAMKVMTETFYAALFGYDEVSFTHRSINQCSQCSNAT